MKNNDANDDSSSNNDDDSVMILFILKVVFSQKKIDCYSNFWFLIIFSSLFMFCT